MTNGLEFAPRPQLHSVDGDAPKKLAARAQWSCNLDRHVLYKLVKPYQRFTTGRKVIILLFAHLGRFQEMDKALYAKLPAGKFVNLPPGRSKAMRAVKGRNNKSTEVRFRLALVRAGVRGWKVQPKELPAKADFFFPRANMIVFIDGCFWHGCPACAIRIPRTNTEYWRTKLEINRARDIRVTRELELQGFIVKRFWEHEVPQCINELIGLLRKWA